MNKFIILILLIFTSSCSMFPEGKAMQGLFAPGTYFHDIHLIIKGDKKIDLKGINHFSKKRKSLICMTSLGNTIASYNFDETTRKTEIYIDKSFLKIDEQKFKIFDHFFRPLALDTQDDLGKTTPKELSLLFVLYLR